MTSVTVLQPWQKNFLLKACNLAAEDNAMDVESQDEEEEEAPSRVVSSEVVVNVRAQVESFDYEGLSDGHSVQTLLTNIAPRHLILAYGSRQVRHDMCLVHCRLLVVQLLAVYASRLISVSCFVYVRLMRPSHLCLQTYQDQEV